MTTFDQATIEVLDRIGDPDGAVWSWDEARLHLQDGYSQFCERTKCLFDVVVLENRPPAGNWQTDLERYFAEHKSGWGLTDDRFQYSDDFERNYGVEGRVGGSWRGPTSMTRPGDSDFDLADTVTNCRGGSLPQSTVGVVRVAWNEQDIYGMTESRMNQIDPYWEGRAGDPQWFIYDSEGLFYLRLVPAADGAASYTTVDGSWGTMRYTDDSTVTADASATGGFGILRVSGGDHPANGTWGTPRRIHPHTDNTKVEVFRLGRNLEEYGTFELPEAYLKYIFFYAMAQLLRRDGPGQNTELADYYMSRFEHGVLRMNRRENRMMPEYEGALGRTVGEAPFGLGDPQPSTADMEAPS